MRFDDLEEVSLQDPQVVVLTLDESREELECLMPDIAGLVGVNKVSNGAPNGLNSMLNTPAVVAVKSTLTN
jgi:hypothetical protein